MRYRKLVAAAIMLGVLWPGVAQAQTIVVHVHPSPSQAIAQKMLRWQTEGNYAITDARGNYTVIDVSDNFADLGDATVYSYGTHAAAVSAAIRDLELDVVNHIPVWVSGDFVLTEDANLWDPDYNGVIADFHGAVGKPLVMVRS